MLALFRSHYAFNHLFLLIYIVIIRFHSFFQRDLPNHDEGTWLYQTLTQLATQSLWSDIVAILLLWFQSILLNILVNNHKLSRESTLFPGLMYVLFISLLPDSLFLHPILLSNLFILGGIFNLVQAGKQLDIRHYVFNAGLFFVLAAFMMPQNLYFPLLGIIGFYNIKSLKWKENLQYLVGLLTGFIIVFSFQFLFGNPMEFPVIFQWISPDILAKDMVYSTLAGLLVYILFLGFVLIRYPSITEKKNIQTRKKIEFFYVLLLFMFVAFLSLKMDDPLYLCYLSLPLGALTGIWMADQKSVLLNEIVHLLALGGLVASHYILN